MSTDRETLVAELAQIAADSLGWDWPAVPVEHIPSATECTTDVVAAILDHLTELGWRESCGVVTRGGLAKACILPRGHRAGWHTDGDVTWGASSLDRRADGTEP